MRKQKLRDYNLYMKKCVYCESNDPAQDEVTRKKITRLD